MQEYETQRNEIQENETKSMQYEEGKLSFKEAQAIPQRTVGLSLICTDGFWKEFHRIFKRKSP